MNNESFFMKKIVRFFAQIVNRVHYNKNNFDFY